MFTNYSDDISQRFERKLAWAVGQFQGKDLPSD